MITNLKVLMVLALLFTACVDNRAEDFEIVELDNGVVCYKFKDTKRALSCIKVDE